MPEANTGGIVRPTGPTATRDTTGMTSEKKPKMARETTAEQLIPEENYEGIVNVIKIGRAHV